MKYTVYHIPSRTFPKNVTRLGDGIFCFRSNQTSVYSGLYINCVGLIIDIDKNINYFKVLTDFIVTLNVFRQEFTSIQWLSQLEYNKFIFNSDLEITEEIKLHLDETSDKIGYFEDFNDMQVHVIASIEVSFSFISVFNKLLPLQNDSFLYNSIGYLSINNSIAMTHSRIYENALLENAMLFQLFEALMTNHEKKYKDESKKCETCQRETKIGLTSRIDRFLTDIKLKNEILSKTIKTIANTRHKFFHSLGGRTRTEYINQTVKKIGNNHISLDDELKHTEGILSAHGIFKAVITTYLLNELLDKNP